MNTAHDFFELSEKVFESDRWWKALEEREQLHGRNLLQISLLQNCVFNVRERNVTFLSSGGTRI